jgi:hypothetical protein
MGLDKQIVSNLSNTQTLFSYPIFPNNFIDLSPVSPSYLARAGTLIGSGAVLIDCLLPAAAFGQIPSFNANMSLTPNSSCSI